MDIPKISMNMSQNALMTAVNAELLSLSLDTIEQVGDQMTELIETAGTQVVSADHIDVLI